LLALALLPLALGTVKAEEYIKRWNATGTSAWEDHSNWLNSDWPYSSYNPIRINNGGTALVSTDIYAQSYDSILGENEGDSGHLIVNSNGYWWTNPLTVGKDGTGSLIITDDGECSSNGISIGVHGTIALSGNSYLGDRADYFINSGVFTLTDNSSFSRISSSFPERTAVYTQNALAILELGLNATRVDFVASDRSFLALGGANLDGTLNLLSLENGESHAGDTLVFLLLESWSVINGSFSDILFDGVALDALDASFHYDSTDSTSGIYRWDDAVGNHYTLDTQADTGHQYTLTVDVAAIPEPGTWVMLAGGLGVLLAFHRRRCKRA
jgi:T5SS/PEP-CTERM-associated repeat protein